MLQLNSHRLLYVIAAALVALAGCASPVLVGAQFDDKLSGPVVLIGYFSDAQHLDIKPCPYDEVPGIDCFGPSPRVKAVVRKVIYGTVLRAQLNLRATYIEHPERFPLGSDELQLIFLEPGVSEKEPAEMSLSGYRPLARLRSGDLAIPVALEEDLPELPCAGEDHLHVVPLEFAAPQPHRPIDEYSSDELAGLRNNPRVSIRANNVYFKYGVTLDTVRGIRDVMMREGQLTTCWK